jgi:ribosomal protein S18 acetylase RimI-like enzyme
MIIEPFAPGDITAFLKLAQCEGWVADEWEFRFLLEQFPVGCFVAREPNGHTTGFVTALLHSRSGWIGNLIVAEESRGQGLGETLFRSALTSLYGAGAETVWLTASPAGAPLYEKSGFRKIDTIVRWVGSGKLRRGSHDREEKAAWLTDQGHDLDQRCWGDDRPELLGVTAQRATYAGYSEEGFIICQPGSAGMQLGPFSAASPASAEQLFNSAAKVIPATSKILLDAPLSNRAAVRLFKRSQLTMAGSTLLMYAGKKPAYRPDLLYGLATMGSCG